MKWVIVDNDFVYNAVQEEPNRLTLIDLRSFQEYKECHIHQSFHVSIPELNNSITNVSQLECSQPSKLKIVYGKLVILYGANNDIYQFMLGLIDKQNCGNFQYFVLANTFKEFRDKYPFLCVSNSKIENYPNIVAHNLFIGGGRHALNGSVLCNLRISHILNVTRLIPNAFDGTHDLANMTANQSVKDYFCANPIQYLKIKALDSDKESLRFAEMIQFIDTALNNEKSKVLIHCQMGVSRSATMLIAYLMHSQRWSLCDAYERVKQCRRRICPNYGFLTQLIDFEKQLFEGASSVDELQKRGVRDMRKYRKYLEGTLKSKPRNEAKMIRDSMIEFVTKQDKLKQNK